MTAGLTPTALKLREMILRGELAPGQRVREAELAERLNISRMPVRQALPALLQEGLIVRVSQRAFAVRTFTHHESLETVRLRAALEGYAARQVAERGPPPALLARLRELLDEGDRLFAGRRLAADYEVRYGDMNAQLHSAVLEAAQFPLLQSFVGRCHLVPFTAPDSIAFAEIGEDEIYRLLFTAHQQHHALVEALAQRQPDRAEFLFREHAVTQEHSMRLNEERRQLG
jgi:GntR family transcriptional regulator of vanillate catabolism